MARTRQPHSAGGLSRKDVVKSAAATHNAKSKEGPQPCWCKKPPGKAEVQCSFCRSWIHYLCMGVSLEQLTDITEADQLFLCKTCVNSPDFDEIRGYIDESENPDGSRIIYYFSNPTKMPAKPTAVDSQREVKAAVTLEQRLSSIELQLSALTKEVKRKPYRQNSGVTHQRQPPNLPPPRPLFPCPSPFPQSSKTSQDDGFRLPYSQQKKGLRRNHTTCGTGENNGTVKGNPPTRSLFIYRVSKSVTTDDMRSFLRNHVSVLDLQVMSNDLARNKSFKLQVTSTDVAKLFDPAFWPAGIGCRFFRPHRPM